MDPDAIQRASAGLTGAVVRTPVVSSPDLDRALGRAVTVKAEWLQHTGSFKVRGALWAVRGLDADQRRRGVIAPSSGNHGRGLAWAAAAAGVPCTVVVSATTPDHKVAAIESHGARVLRAAPDRRDQTAADMASETGAVLVHPGEHVDVIAGAGSLVLELLEDSPVVPDAVVVPVGSGGLLAATAIVCQDGPRVIGVEPAMADEAARSLATGVRQPKVNGASSVADGLLGGIGGTAFDALKTRAVEMIAVTDEEILAAGRALRDALGVVAEPSAVVGLAALRHVEPGSATVVVTGGNAGEGWLG